MRDINCTRYTSPPHPSPGGQGLHRMPVQLHPVLLLAPSPRRWDPKELLSGVTAALQCSSLGSWGSHQLSTDVCQNWEWLLWMFTAAQNPAPIGNTKSECLKSIFLEIFFRQSSGEKYFWNTAEAFLTKCVQHIHLFACGNCSLVSKSCSWVDLWLCAYLLPWAFVFFHSC